MFDNFWGVSVIFCLKINGKKEIESLKKKSKCTFRIEMYLKLHNIFKFSPSE